MSNVLKVDNLCKVYPKFKLDNVSFDLEEGKITGFIGRNGAGKTTTIKAMLNLIAALSGNVTCFSKDYVSNEAEIKQKIGYVSGGVNFYSNKKLKVITDVTKRFYPEWNDDALKEYMELFKLDENKTPSQLSEGMKVKYSLATALSHNAKLLILDEPTSGLDPVSRDELLDIFLDLEDKGITIFFSTHITSDLDKCADNIIYIKNGRIIADSRMKEFINEYKVAEFEDDNLSEEIKSGLIGLKRAKDGYTALVKSDECDHFSATKEATLDDIMIHLDKEEN